MNYIRIVVVDVVRCSLILYVEFILLDFIDEYNLRMIEIYIG